jgi:predicted metal-dependent peptidase
VGLWWHEVGHLALGHLWRQAGRDGKRWNAACDYALNALAGADSITLPKGALLRSDFAGLSAEEIYTRLEAEDQDQGQGQGQSGEAATGSFEESSPDNSEGEAEAGEWAEAAQSAAQAAKKIGTMSAGAARALDGLAKAKAPWAELLKRFLTDTVVTRSSWSRASRRFWDSPIFMPGKQPDGMGGLVVAIDTSGSVSGVLLKQFEAEIQGLVADMCPASVLVIDCDAEVQSRTLFERGDTPKLVAKGGGGTRFAPVFDLVEAEQIQPAALVYFTDLESRDLAGLVDPGFPVLWAVWGGSDAETPFGEVIRLE